MEKLTKTTVLLVSQIYPIALMTVEHLFVHMTGLGLLADKRNAL